MDIYQILCLLLGCVCVFQSLLLIFINKKYGKILKGMSGRGVEDVNIKNGVRYTIDQTVVDTDGNANISLSQKDILLSQNKTEIVGVKNKVKPGKYTLLATVQNEEKFNIRIGSYVKEYKHNQDIVLNEGEEITCVNTSVILR